jgi:hypothetical protein
MARGELTQQLGRRARGQEIDLPADRAAKPTLNR